MMTVRWFVFFGFLMSAVVLGQISQYPSVTLLPPLPSVTNLLAGDGAGAAADSGIVPANVAQQGTSYTLGTANFLQGSASGWQLGSDLNTPRFPILKPAGTGSFHLAMLPGTNGSTSGLYITNSTDTTFTNYGEFVTSLVGGIALIQSANFGTGTPVTVQNFGEFSGSSALTQWNVQFGGTTKFQVTPTTMKVPITPATTGQRYVCIDTAGQLVSQTTACVGT